MFQRAGWAGGACILSAAAGASDFGSVCALTQYYFVLIARLGGDKRGLVVLAVFSATPLCKPIEVAALLCGLLRPFVPAALLLNVDGT